MIWYIKQLFPLQYVSEYWENGKKKLTIWRMWMGKCFAIRDYELAQ